MAKHEFSELESQYQGFQHPSALIKINDVALSDKKKGYPISDIRVDLTCGLHMPLFIREKHMMQQYGRKHTRTRCRTSRVWRR